MNRSIASGERASGETVCIVVIENNPDDRRLIEEALELWTQPYHLVCYDNGITAIEALKHMCQDAGDRVLVLLDWNLPGMHGSKVLKQLQDEVAMDRCFVVVFTSSSSEVDRKLAESLGASLFMTKAMDLDDFFYSLVSLQTMVRHR